MNTLKVLWVEDPTVYRRSPRKVFSRRRDVRVRSCSSASFIDGSEGRPPDVIVVDAVDCAARLEDLSQAVRRASAGTGVVILSREDLLHEHADLIRAGAVGYVTYGASEQEVWRAVRAGARGEMWVQRGLVVKLIAELQGAKEYRGTVQTTDREQRVLEGVVSGKANKEIAAELKCSDRTVKSDVASLRRKTGTSNRSGLVVYAVMTGLAPVR